VGWRLACRHARPTLRTPGPARDRGWIVRPARRSGARADACRAVQDARGLRDPRRSRRSRPSQRATPTDRWPATDSILAATLSSS
jgi:hypothetical protein